MRNLRSAARSAGSPARNIQPIAALISLGCSKNTVDSEHLLAHLVKDGFLIAEEPSEADICLVNTCGFIQSAREETAEVLRKLRSRADDSRSPLIVALGCMVERACASPEMQKFLEAADATVSFAEYPHIARICRRLLSSRFRPSPTEPPEQKSHLRHSPPSSFLSFLQHSPRLRIGSPHTAYLKVSEGCPNRCRFCSIPMIRGVQTSFPIKKLLDEAAQLVAAGARELNLIAQDTTSYGRDLGLRNGLARLLEKLAASHEHVWHRILYGHPRHVTHELLRVMAATPNICPYLDIPLQHITDRMLRVMGRGMSRAQTLNCLERIHRILPNAALRTTFIVGYPGETDSDVEELLDLVSQGLFAHVGVFTFSAEPGTPAAKLPDSVPEPIKAMRKRSVMLLQQQIRKRQLRSFHDQTLEIMLDEMVTSKQPRLNVPVGTWAIGRTIFDAPEVDGVVYVCGTPTNKMPGDRFKIKVIDSTDYDLIGEPSA